MKKFLLFCITIVLFHLLGILSVYALTYDVDKGVNIINKLKSELQSSGFTFEKNENPSFSSSDTIYYNNSYYGQISVDEMGIGLLIENDDYIKGYSSSTTGFYGMDFPLEHILYYFEEYKGSINVINGVIKEVNFNGYDDSVEIFPGNTKKYYLSIRYFGDSNQSFLPNDHLVTKYILKNKCSEKSNEDINGEENERTKCLYNSIKEQYLDAKIEIKVIKSPDFITLKKDKDGLDYFEIDLEDNMHSDIGEHVLEFDVLLNGQKQGFKKQTKIKVFEPVILAIGKIGPEGGSIYNIWEDIFLSFDKGVLDRTHKIVYMKSLDGTRSVVTANPPIGDDIRLHINVKEPSGDLISYNYLIKDREQRPWTLSKSSTDKYFNEEEKKYNICVNEYTNTDNVKYECYKEYMGLWNETNTNKSIHSNTINKKLDGLLLQIDKKVSKKSLIVRLKYYKSLRTRFQILQGKYKKGKNSEIVNYLYDGINKQYLIIFKEYILSIKKPSK